MSVMDDNISELMYNKKHTKYFTKALYFFGVNYEDFVYDVKG